MKTNPALLVLALCASSLGACASYGPATIQMQLDPALAGASVQADVIGADEKKMATLDALPVSKYWQSPGARQNFAAKSFRFGAGAESSRTLPANDPAWAQWSGAKDVVVVVDLPGVFEDLPGAADPRRKTISLKDAGGGPVKLEIGPKGIVQLP